MKRIARIVTISLAALAVAVQGADRYVVPPGGSGTPTAPYTSWDTAATNLQDAAAATAAGDTVWVTNGTYYLTNQVTVTNFAVKSFNNGVLDPASTIINGNNYAGKTVTNRCFTLSHSNALVEGFTITNGFTYGGAAVNAAANGGGVSMTAGTLRNCLVTGNTCSNAANGGGGVYAVGGWLVLMSGRKWHRLNMRWALELAGELLLLAAFAAYAILAAGTGSWSVVVILVAHCAAVVWRIAEVRREEGLTRHLTAKHEERGR